MTDDSMKLFGYKCERPEEFLIIFRFHGTLVNATIVCAYVINSKDFRLTVEKTETIQFLQKQVSLSVINMNPEKDIV